MAGLGADVIKVEKAGGMKPASTAPSPKTSPTPRKAASTLPQRQQKGVTLNLDKPQGKDVFKKLSPMRTCSSRIYPRLYGRLGLGYDVLKAINPKLVMVSITPFGQTGPYKTGKPITSNSCGAGGMSIGTGDPNREPLTMPLSQGGYEAGLSAATGILAALLAREKTGKGQFIDISEVEVWRPLTPASTC